MNLYVDYIFNKSVEKHYNAFSKGFLKVCGGRVLKLFHSHELKSVIVGNQNYDWHVLESTCEYKHGYSSSDQTIQWFWEVFHEMTEEEKKKFLLFLTGSDRIPITGMKSVMVRHICFLLKDMFCRRRRSKIFLYNLNNKMRNIFCFFTSANCICAYNFIKL